MKFQIFFLHFSVAYCLNHIGVANANIQEYDTELKYKLDALDMYKRLNVNEIKINAYMSSLVFVNLLGFFFFFYFCFDLIWSEFFRS